MTAEKRYEILNSLPTYGPMYVAVTGNGRAYYSEGFPVRFYKADGTEWIANLEPGRTNLKKIIELDKTQNLLVIACGACYLMNPNEPKPIKVFEDECFGIFRASSDRLILKGEICLTIIEPDGSHWNTSRISWGGFEEIKVNDNVVTGLSFNPTYDADEWVAFSYNLDTKVLTGGSCQ